jgi:hypothetical protein
VSWLRELIRDTGELVGGTKGRKLADDYDGTLIGLGRSWLGLDQPPPAPEVVEAPPPSPWGYVAAGVVGAVATVAAVAVTKKK